MSDDWIKLLQGFLYGRSFIVYFPHEMWNWFCNLLVYSI